MAQQIIAIGGGGFILEPDNFLLEEYILQQTNKATPNVCFIGTASGDQGELIASFYKTFNSLNCNPTHLSLFGHPPEDLTKFLCSQDVVYVGPGSARNLLAVWKEWGLGNSLQTALENGVVLAGVSAGSVCWYTEGVTMWHPPKTVSTVKGLGFLEGSQCPHYNVGIRREVYHRLVLERKISAGVGVEDGVAVHYLDGKIVACISSRSEGKAYQVYAHDGQIEELALPITVLKK